MRLTILAVASAVSTAGSAVARIAVMLLLARQSPWAVSAALVLDLIPGVLLAPVLAPLVDRVESRRLLSMTLLGQAGVVAAMAAAASSPVEVILGLSFVSGCLASVNGPAMMLLAEHADEPESARVARTYSVLDAARMAGTLAGPAVGGVAVAVLGFAVTMVLDAASSCVLVVVMAMLRLRRYPQESVEGPQSWWQRVAAAPVLLAGDRVVRVAMGALACAIVFTSIFSVAEVFYIRDTLGASPPAYGLITAVFVLGRMTGSMFVAPRIPAARQRGSLVVAGLLMGIGLSAAGMSGSLLGAGIGFAAAGLANSLQVNAIAVVISTRLPVAAKGRAFAAMSALNGAVTMVGSAAGAPAVSALGPAGALILAGLGTLGTTLAAAPRLLRSVPHAAPPDVGEHPRFPAAGRSGA